MVQVRREATDLMLQTASAEHELDWKDFFREQIKLIAERCHAIPADYNERLEEILRKREQKNLP